MKCEAVERQGSRNAARDLFEDGKARRLNRSGRGEIRHHPRFGAVRRSRADDAHEPLELRPALNDARNARYPLDPGDLFRNAPLEAPGRVGENKLDCWFAKARCTKCLMDPNDDIDQWFLSARDKGRKHRYEHHGRHSLYGKQTVFGIYNSELLE